MSLTRIASYAVLAAAVTAGGLLACSTSTEEEGDDVEAAGAAIVQDRTVVLGRCRTPSLSFDPNVAMPPAAQLTAPDPRDVTLDEVMNSADLVATIRTTRGGKRSVVALDARLTAGFGRGNARVTVERTSAMTTTLMTETGKVEYQVRTLLAPRTGMMGGLTIGGTGVALGSAVLQREPATGRGWLRFATHDDQLVAVVAGCTFDEKAWTVLADANCETALFEDGGADAGTCSIPLPVVDAGVDAAMPDASAADASTLGDAGPDAAVAEVDAGAAERRTPDEGELPPGEDGAEDSYAGPGGSDPLPKPKKAAASSGCSATASPANAGGLVQGFALVLGLALGRARRRRKA